MARIPRGGRLLESRRHDFSRASGDLARNRFSDLVDSVILRLDLTPREITYDCEYARILEEVDGDK